MNITLCLITNKSLFYLYFGVNGFYIVMYNSEGDLSKINATLTI